MTTFTPRDYQVGAIEAGVKHLMHGTGNNFAVLPCGSGKSVVTAGVADRLDGEVLVLQPSKEILYQNAAKMRSFGKHPAIFSASAGRKQIDHITFATIGSVVNRMEAFMRFKHIIVDECHLVPETEGSMYRNFFDRWEEHRNEKLRLFGLTATPFRLGTNSFGSQIKFLGRSSPKIWDKMIYCVQIKDIQSLGYLANMDYFRHRGIDPAMLRLNSSGSDYTDASIKAAFQASDMEAKIVNIVERLMSGEKSPARKSVLVFTKFVEEAANVAKYIPGAAMVSGETPQSERDRILEDFKAGRIKVVCNVGVLCLDEKTEILTSEGWVGIDEMNYEHNVACWSTDGSIVFSPPQYIVRRDRKPGERMVVAKGNAIDFRVTEDHRMVRNVGRKREWGEQLARDTVGKRFDFPSSGHAEPEIVSVAPTSISEEVRRVRINATAYNYRKNGMSTAAARQAATEMVDRKAGMTHTMPHELTMDDCRFIGFWLADGTMSMGRCSISQSMRYANIVRWFDDVLRGTGLHYTRTVTPPRGNQRADVVRWSFAKGTGGHGQYIKGGYYRLSPYLDKCGSHMLWGLDNEQFGALLEGFWYGDGEHGTTEYESSSARWSVAGTQKKLYDMGKVRLSLATIIHCSAAGPCAFAIRARTLLATSGTPPFFSEANCFSRSTAFSSRYSLHMGMSFMAVSFP